MSTAPRKIPPWVVGAAFALTPWVTLGFGTPIAFAFVAFALRSWWLGAATAFYVAAFITEFVTSGSAAGTTEDRVFNWALVVLIVLGGVHAATLARTVTRAFAGRREGDDGLISKMAERERASIANDSALRRALRGRERRRRAREIVATDPALADELGIGRIGSHREFDDGGLIDVNRASADALARLPGFTASLAERVVTARERLEGLRSDADLIVHADVPPEVVSRLSDRLLYRPWDPASDEV
ncbi:MAG TPA: helix-hairpin-helix domain-containing protein [Micromonosporaceae bacterium]|nr:helix-hairpin-helix domain-containing protein [Micromonosporaceae bacterium]